MPHGRPATVPVRGPARSPRPRPQLARLAVGLLALLCALGVALPATAGAHAQLESTSPPRDALVQTQPKLVSFSFGEPVTGTTGAVRVYDTSGARVDDGNAGHRGLPPNVMAVGLKPNLRPGTYTATYRVVSADSHVVTGGFSFSIGRRTAGGANVGTLLAGQKTGAVTENASIVARALQYGAIALGTGSLAFLLLVWLPAVLGVGGALAGASDATVRRLRRTIVVAAAVGAITALLALVLEGAEAAGVSFWQAIDGTILGDVLDTRFGTTWAAAVGVWALAGVGASLAVRRRADEALVPDRRRLLLLAVPLVALLALPTLTGHSSVQPPVWLLVVMNVVHVAAMSVWIGGLVALVLAVPAATRRLEDPARTRLLAGAVGRFSPLALASVIALLVTGIVQSLVEIDAWSQLLDTAYGRAVLIKIVLLLILIGLGAQNRQRTVPRLRTLATEGASPGAAGVALRRALRAEVAIVVVVLVVTGALSGYPPAKTAANGPANITTRLGPVQLQLTVDPARVGGNEVHLYLLDPTSGAQFDGTKELTVTAGLPAKGIGPITLETEQAGPGHYVVPQALLPGAGTWTFTITDRVSEFDEYEKQVKVHVR